VTVEEIIGCEGMDGNSDYIPAIEIEWAKCCRGRNGNGVWLWFCMSK
jgi:hypothetical protein